MKLMLKLKLKLKLKLNPEMSFELKLILMLKLELLLTLSWQTDGHLGLPLTGRGRQEIMFSEAEVVAILQRLD